MVRKLLGNVRGPTGPQGPTGKTGPKGDPGGFNGESIGVTNKINISKLTPYGSDTPISTIELENGLIHYNDIIWSLEHSVVLNGVKHSFRVEDYLTNPNYYSGYLRFEVRDSSNTSVQAVSVEKGVVYEIDLTGRETQKYKIQLRPTNATAYSGHIEKPMLVEGDMPVLWNPSDTDKSFLLKQNRVTGRFYLPEINNDGTFENLSVYNLSPSEFMSVQDGGILFEDGLYLITNTTNLSQSDGLVALNIRVNGVSERIVQFPAETSGNFSHVLSLSKGDVMDVRVSYTGTSKGTLPVNARNGFTITKL